MMRYLLQHGLDNSAERTPDHEAMRFNKTALTYAELSQKSNQLARCLIDQGVQRGDRVGIYLNKSLETAIALYGVMKAGAAYVPLDPRAPANRLRDVIDDCDIQIIISHPPKRGDVIALIDPQSPLRAVIGVSAGDDLPLRAISWEDVATFADTLPAVTLMEQDLAYIMVTSGSTGRPKGIMHTHASGLAYATMAVETYGVTGQDRLSNHSPLHFDMSTFDYFSGPIAGATTVIIPEAYSVLPASLSQLIEAERLTIWYSVPFALIQLLLRGALEKRDLSSLRWVMFGGEPFQPVHLKALMRQWPHARFSNVYGPAEVNQCTYYHLPPPDDLPNDSAVPIGVIWDNAEGVILDTDDTPIFDDRAGELVVRTPTMMQGYWNRPDLNARAFYRRPDAGGEAVFYRTGDLVRRRPDDGLLDFIGRKDRQVKVRGYRVELDEVENALSTHPAVAECAAYPVRRGDDETIVEGAIILREGHTAEAAEIIGHVTGTLPHYAVPQSIQFMADFPRGGTGKIDRRALQSAAEAREV